MARSVGVLAAVAVVSVASAQGINSLLSTCNATSPSQMWKVGTVGHELTNVVNGVTYCLDVEVGDRDWLVELATRASHRRSCFVRVPLSSLKFSYVILLLSGRVPGGAELAHGAGKRQLGCFSFSYFSHVVFIVCWLHFFSRTPRTTARRFGRTPLAIPMTTIQHTTTRRGA